MLFGIRAFDTRKLDSLFLNQFDQSIHVFKEEKEKFNHEQIRKYYH